MKRLFGQAWIGALLAALVFLCACGSEAAPAPTQTQNKAAEETKATEAPAKEASPPSAEGSGAPEGEAANEDALRPHIKEAIDSYEAFVDEYCAFMQEYSLTDLSKLSTYNELVSREIEMSEKFEALEKEELTTEEALYYSEVGLRCSQKLLDVASSMLK